MDNDVFGLGSVKDLAGKVKGVVIRSQGAWTKEGGESFCEFEETDVENIKEAIEQIPKVFYKKARGCASSYHGKHILEEWRETHAKDKHQYISNGCFIIAMLHKGYVAKAMKKQKKGVYSPNVLMNFGVLAEG
jgi:hypothetical protein